MPSTLAPPDACSAAPEDERLELERLFAAPAAPSRPVNHGRRPVLYEAARRALILGWLALFVGAFAMEDSADTSVHSPLWADLTAAALFLFLLAALLLASTGAPRVALAFSGLAAGLGVPLGIECRVSMHHLGAWWMVETAAFAALALASVACLALRPRSG